MLALVCGCTAPADVPSGAEGDAVQDRPLNEHCPRSGEPVAADSLTRYRGVVVGFCNPHCRDDFAANVAARPRDRAFFDALLDAGRPAR